MENPYAQLNIQFDTAWAKTASRLKNTVVREPRQSTCTCTK